WRTSAKLAVRASTSGVRIGLFVPKTHDVVRIHGCAAHHASINAALEAISTACAAAKIHGYDEASGKGDLRYVKLEVQRSTGLVQVTLVWNASSEEQAGRPLRKLVSALTEQEMWHSIWANFNAADKHTSRILAFEKEAAWREGLAVVELGLGPTLRWKALAPGSDVQDYGGVHSDCLGARRIIAGPTLDADDRFISQANLCAFERIVAAVRRFVPSGSAVVELYGGVGTIGLHLADTVGRPGMARSG
ncbi:unnamed protein product, partial [Symbiodinium pilosum]